MSELNSDKILFETFSNYLKTSLQASQFKEALETYEESEINELIKESFNLVARKKKNHYSKVLFSNHIKKKNLLLIAKKDHPFLISTALLSLEKQGLNSDVFFNISFLTYRDQNNKLISIKIATNTNDKKNLQGCLSRESLLLFIMEEDKVKNIKDIKKKVDKDLSLSTVVVDDFFSMRESFITLFKSYKKDPELSNFLQWCDDGRIVYLGSRYFSVKNVTKGSNFYGFFKNQTYRNLPCFTPSFIKEKKNKLFFPKESVELSPVYKKSPIHSLELAKLDEEGKIKGFYQFLCLFTPDFFSYSAFRIPWVKKKLIKVFKHFPYLRASYHGRRLSDLFNSIPKDFLLYLSEKELTDLVKKVFYSNNNCSNVFYKRNLLNQFLIILIYLPKERYFPALESIFIKEIEETTREKVIFSRVLIDNFSFVRFVYHLSFKKLALSIKKSSLEKRIESLSLPWEAHLKTHLQTRSYSLNVTFPLIYQKLFTPLSGYEDALSASKALSDGYPYLNVCEKGILQVFSPHEFIPLSKLMPIWDSFGIHINTESSFKLFVKKAKKQNLVWLHLFERGEDTFYCPSFKKRMEEGFLKVWQGFYESDLFNQLISKSTLVISEVNIFRAYSKALKQMLFPFSPKEIAFVLGEYSSFAELLIKLFKSKFNPALDSEKRKKEIFNTTLKIKKFLKGIKRINDDRILRALWEIIIATTRTNYYIPSRERFLSFKFLSALIKGLPTPIPLYEIFIYSPKFEAINLRGGLVARGGIRWSDRTEDYRDEILGLMKSQMVKNAPIIPVGAKGGFILKDDNVLSPQEKRELAIESYGLMIRGMLDITDNIKNGKVISPTNVVCHDENNPYLVVAADKGTATFSDHANLISKEYDFWLGDAFASGGHYGYDHKHMGITSKGAWISVQNHFISLGYNWEKEGIKTIGVGDMSGDVFGNGMLQSDRIFLIGAFNHQYIFIDPSPDPQKSFQERKRLFHSNSSSWGDYNVSLLSEGGGIFSRESKSIILNPILKKTFSIPETIKYLSPDELIIFILKANVDLIWFGGIGTYVKGSEESNVDVKDRQNDWIRIDAKDLRAKVIAEGANLGVTQKGRIEAALKGTRVNTDAIDNSAGVTCSDYEVNIKILLHHLCLIGEISFEERNSLLLNMEKEVEKKILDHNLAHNILLNFLEVSSKGNVYKKLIESLENNPHFPLRRKLEAFPPFEEIEKRTTKNLTRPELCILLSYVKINTYEMILSEWEAFSKNPEVCLIYLKKYFPEFIENRFSSYLEDHPLKKEIVATVLANEMINNFGLTYIEDLTRINSLPLKSILRGYSIISRLFPLDQVKSIIERDKNLLKSYSEFFILSTIFKQLTFIYLKQKIIIKNNKDLVKSRVSYCLRIMDSSSANDSLQWALFPLILEFSSTSLLESEEIFAHGLDSLLSFYKELQLDLFFEIALRASTKKDWEVTLKDQLISELIEIYSRVIFLMKENPKILEKEKFRNQHLNIIKKIKDNLESASTSRLSFVTYCFQHLKGLLY